MERWNKRRLDVYIVYVHHRSLIYIDIDGWMDRRDDLDELQFTALLTLCYVTFRGPTLRVTSDKTCYITLW